VSFDKRRLNLDRLPEMNQSLVKFGLSGQGNSQAAMGRGVVLTHAEHLADSIQGEVDPAGLQGDNAKLEERVSMLRIGLSDLQIAFFRLAQITCLVMAQGESECLSNRWHAEKLEVCAAGCRTDFNPFRMGITSPQLWNGINAFYHP